MAGLHPHAAAAASHADGRVRCPRAWPLNVCGGVRFGRGALPALDPHHRLWIASLSDPTALTTRALPVPSSLSPTAHTIETPALARLRLPSLALLPQRRISHHRRPPLSG
eukprot:602765-Prymnesium_polylepis.2